ncbi:30S ribosomal protein S7 [Gammaproteobacteria bacterium]|nr:30S ribosomal protein S7 [Gammaproteobacteria bacterium]
MSRGKRASVEYHGNAARKLIDNRYAETEYNILIEKMIRSVMRDGKGSLARRIVYDAMSTAAQRANDKHRVLIGDVADVRDLELQMLVKVIEIITPKVEVKTKRFGGANYQVPIVVNKSRGQTLALRWLITSARGRSEGASMVKKLSNEIIDTLDGKSGSITKKETQDKMAMANRVNANLVRRERTQSDDA